MDGEFKLVRGGETYDTMLNIPFVNSCSYSGSNQASDDAYTSSFAVSLPPRGLTLKAKLHICSITLFVMLLILEKELTSYKTILKHTTAAICD